MNIWGVLALVKPKDVWSLTKLLLRFPLFAIPTVKATIKCVRLSNKYFGKTHHRNNAANAFRHALWNYLIVMECKVWTRHSDKAILWATLITNWHEEFSPNKDLARAMDLHNNKVGRNLYKQNKQLPAKDGITTLLEMVPRAEKISKNEDLQKYTDRLVHLTD